MTDFIALDWGTTSFRAYRVAGDGRVLDTISAAEGILAVADGTFEEALERQIGTWDVTLPVMAAGIDESGRLFDVFNQQLRKAGAGTGPDQLDPETRAQSAGSGAGSNRGHRKLQKSFGADSFALGDETRGSAGGGHDKPGPRLESRQAIGISESPASLERESRVRRLLAVRN